MRRNLSTLLVLFCVLAGGSVFAAGHTIAYSNPPGPGNQSSSGISFGMDFDVVSPISVSALGAFDDGQKGLTGSITVAIWNRASTPPAVEPGLSVVITGTDGMVTPGRGDRIVQLGSPVTLPAGFHGSIVAFGYGVDLNGNGIADNPNHEFSITNTGGGLISFVKTVRQGPAPMFPAMASSTLFSGQYGGPTFVFDAAALPPPPPEPAGRPFLGAVSIFYYLFDHGTVVLGVLLLMGLILFSLRRRSRHT